VKPKFFLVMGVSGCGKSTIGKELARRLGWDFYDADDYHPSGNIAKMVAGVPLNDDDRYPWLDSLHMLISSCLKANRPGLLACSALKDSYRQKLLKGNKGVKIIFLKGSYSLIKARLEKRPTHYMQPIMLQSQFDTLEEPHGALVIDVSPSVDEIVAQILEKCSVTY
jgi:gluconokinase